MKIKTCVIFGGSGFIGSHLALHLINSEIVESIFIADIADKRADFDIPSDKVTYIKLDVRDDILNGGLPDTVDVIFNFAAIHREPGHEPLEYYETNIRGAENVCKWADDIGCKSIFFTSSIAPYGLAETERTEQSIPVPNSPYGGSKLVAEKIHQVWAKGGEGRSLVIVRPGVVFGPGERGNVSRLVKATLKNYFVFTGNRNTRKAGGYVKELVASMVWALDEVSREPSNFLLYNFSMPDTPSVGDYVSTVYSVENRRGFTPSVPYSLLLGVSYVVEFIALIFNIKQPISPVRVKKLTRSNNIKPSVLLKRNYRFEFNLKSAMEDWKKDRPSEWR